MTTIAYRDGRMAADSGLIGHGTIEGSFQKIMRVEHAGNVILMGVAGFAAHASLFFDWIQDGSNPKPEIEKDDGFDGLVVRRVGDQVTLWFYDRFLIGLDVQAGYVSIGSGRDHALGALHHGADALQAVQAAIDHDTGSVGPIVEIAF